MPFLLSLRAQAVSRGPRRLTGSCQAVSEFEAQHVAPGACLCEGKQTKNPHRPPSSSRVLYCSPPPFLPPALQDSVSLSTTRLLATGGGYSSTPKVTRLPLGSSLRPRAPSPPPRINKRDVLTTSRLHSAVLSWRGRDASAAMYASTAPAGVQPGSVIESPNDGRAPGRLAGR